MQELLGLVLHIAVVVLGIAVMLAIYAGGLWLFGWFLVLTGWITREQRRETWGSSGGGGPFEGGAGSASGGC